MDSHISHTFETLVDFEFPAGDVVAVIPYALPLIFISIMLFLFQRHLPRENARRNLSVFASIICLLASIVMLLYAGFGSGVYGLPEFGSWWTFVGVIQYISDTIFGTVLFGILYVIVIGVMFSLIARSVIAPPNPDFTALREDLKIAQRESTDARAELQKVDADNKRLNEYISEKEETLASLQGEVESLKEQVKEREGKFAEIEAKVASAEVVTALPNDRERELLDALQKRDITIQQLQSEAADLQLLMESRETPTTPAAPISGEEMSPDVQVRIAQLEAAIKDRDSKLVDFSRRADTASEVSDSLISDLAQLITQVESSEIDASSKKTISTLVQGLGRAVSRVAGPPGEKKPDTPKIEMIGAVMIVHEIIDGIKKMTRS
ncbi:MAG: hypothetical protein ACXADL_15645 [Candidatus Thorarchaeota archaeon]|jgi:hypothetical protein